MPKWVLLGKLPSKQAARGPDNTNNSRPRSWAIWAGRSWGLYGPLEPMSAGHMNFPNGQLDNEARKETSDGTYLDSVPARNALASKGNERVTRTSGKGWREGGGRNGGRVDGEGSITAVQEHPARLDGLIPRLFSVPGRWPVSLRPTPPCLPKTGFRTQRMACSSRLGDQHGVGMPGTNAPAVMGSRDCTAVGT